MSRVSNALNMYFLLQSRGLMRVEEIAEELEIKPRMVKEYKKDLEIAGIYIESKLGRYGGYYIENKRNLAALNITKDEISALKMAKETIKSGKYHYGATFEVLVSKIVNSRSDQYEIHYYNKVFNESDEIIQRERKTWIDINIAVSQKKLVKMEYKSLKEYGLEIKERVVEPYGIFDYKGATYFYGYCIVARNIRFFKLSRIINYKILESRFDVKIDFDFGEVLERSFGIYNDKMINLKLKIYYPMSEIVKDKQISKCQRIIQIDEKSIYFEAQMQGYTEIKTWIMSMASKVEVIEPLELKNDIIKEIKKIAEIYD